MNKKLIYLSTALISGFTAFTSITGCSSNNPLKAPVNNIVTEKVTVENEDSMGTLVIKMDDRAYKTKGFSTKATMMDPYITQIKIDVVGHNMVPVTKTVTWVRNVVLTTAIKVPSGKNRIISVSGLDSSGKPIAKIMGFTHVYQKTTVPILLNYGTTAAARVMYNILNSTNHEMLEIIDPLKLKTFVYKITGYADAKDTYNGVNPLKIDVNAITQRVIDSNGDPDVDNIIGLVTEASPAKVKVFVKDKNGNPVTSGVLISANDISANPAFNNGTSFDLLVDPGVWEISATVYLNAAGTTTIVPANPEEVRKLILGPGQVLNAKKTITISGTDAQENTLTLDIPQVIL